jgi:hypothetical protein
MGIFADYDLNGDDEETALDDSLEALRAIAEDAPVVRLVNAVIARAAEARASAEAFWALYRGAKDAGLRDRCCESAHYAYWLARAVDRAPSDDPRAGASRQPELARCDAQHVDRAARDDTRAAAARAQGAAAAAAGPPTRARGEGALLRTVCASRRRPGAGGAQITCLGVLETRE